jgi:GNAT superfamily N-acetyltransferase
MLPLQIKETKDKDAAIRHFAYYLDGVLVGESRIRYEMMGQIDVREPYQNRGVGMEILKHLVREGGRSAYAASEAGRRLLKRAGFTEEEPGSFYLRDPKRLEGQ